MPNPKPTLAHHARLREAGATLAVGALVAAACLLIAQLNPAFFWHDDYQLGGIPALVDIHRAVTSGEWPLVSPYSWCAGALAGEYQAGIFSPMVVFGMVTATALGGTMAGMATLYSTYLVAIAAMGAFRVGRVEGLPIEHATLVAVVAALNGWNMTWAASNWIVAMSGFAAITWAWWALAAALRPGAGTGRLLVAAAMIFSLMTAGWPHTIFMAAIVSAWLLVREATRSGPWRPLGTVVVAWLLGIGLSAHAWLTFVEFISYTMRPAVGATLQWAKLVPAAALPGLVIPSWVVVWDAYAQPAVALANGLVPTAVLLAMVATSRRRAFPPGGWAFLLAGVGLALACLPSVGMFRWSFRWLPLFHMALALAAATWLAERQAAASPVNPPRWARSPDLARWVPNPGAWAVLAVLVVGAWSRLAPVFPIALPGALLVLAIVWAAAEDRRPRLDPFRRWAPTGAALGALLATYAVIPSALMVPFWHMDETIRQVAPLKPDVRYMVLASGSDYFTNGETLPAWGSVLRPGNTPLIAGVHTVNGYSPLQLRGLTHTFVIELHGYLHDKTIARLATAGTRPGGLLQRLGIDGVVVGDASRRLIPAIEANGWTVSTVAADGVVMHRVGPAAPQVRTFEAARMADMESYQRWWKATDLVDDIPALEATAQRPADTLVRFAKRDVRRVDLWRNSETFEVGPGAGTALVAVHRAWLPGYEAIAPDGRSLSLVALDGAIIGVEVPQDVSGLVTLRYRPRGLMVGLGVAGATALLVLLLGLRAVRRGSRLRPPAAPAQAP